MKGEFLTFSMSHANVKDRDLAIRRPPVARITSDLRMEDGAVGITNIFVSESSQSQPPPPRRRRNATATAAAATTNDHPDRQDVEMFPLASGDGYDMNKPLTIGYAMYLHNRRINGEKNRFEMDERKKKERAYVSPLWDMYIS